MSLQQLLSDYASGPALLRRSVQQVSNGQHRQHPIPDKWSIQEVVCHLADFETIYSDRMKRVLAEDNPELPAACPDAFATTLHYSQRNTYEELNVIAAVRSQTSRLLNSLNLECFQRTGVHSEDGPLTLETLLERIVEHIPHHLKFIDQKVAALANAI
jgi:uncharacterized damage-inducible protein DinB